MMAFQANTAPRNFAPVLELRYNRQGYEAGFPRLVEKKIYARGVRVTPRLPLKED
jgi:hypothetical protein